MKIGPWHLSRSQTASLSIAYEEISEPRLRPRWTTASGTKRMALATKRSDTKSLFEEAYEFYVIRSGLCVLLEQFLMPRLPHRRFVLPIPLGGFIMCLAFLY